MLATRTVSSKQGPFYFIDKSPPPPPLCFSLVIDVGRTPHWVFTHCKLVGTYNGSRGLARAREVEVLLKERFCFVYGVAATRTKVYGQVVRCGLS